MECLLEITDIYLHTVNWVGLKYYNLMIQQFRLLNDRNPFE